MTPTVCMLTLLCNYCVHGTCLLDLGFGRLCSGVSCGDREVQLVLESACLCCCWYLRCSLGGAVLFVSSPRMRLLQQTIRLQYY